MRVRMGLDVDDETWKTFFDACPDASPFHGPAWHAAWQEESGAAIVPVSFQFDDGSRALATVGLGRVYRGLVEEARCGVAGGYGGLISPDRLTDRHVELAFSALRRRFPEFSCQSSPHMPWPDAAPAGSRQSSTLVLPLADLPTLRLAYNQNRRRDAQQTAPYAIWTFEHPTPDDLAPFLEIYRLASEQWAFDRHRRSDGFWRAVGRHLGPDLVLHLASQGGQVAAARLVARRGTIAYDLAFVVHPAHRKRQAATAVTEAALLHAHACGASSFDFMPSGELAGVLRFKASFGARPLRIFETHHSSGLARVLGAARRVLSRT